MKRIIIFSFFLFSILNNFLISQTVVHIEKAGTLKDILISLKIDIDTVSSLKLTGTIDARDFKTLWGSSTNNKESGDLNKYSNDVLRNLDLSKLTSIASYKGKYGTDLQKNINGHNWNLYTVEYKEQEIPAMAFCRLNSLENILLPNFITKINNYAFSGLKIKDIVLPNSVIEIGKYSFQYCKHLINLKLPHQLVRLEKWAFAYCNSLTSEITIPKTVRFIGTNPFTSSKQISKIKLEKGNLNYFSDEKDVIYSADLDTLILLPPYFSGEYRINSTTKDIRPNAGVAIDGLTKIIFPDMLKEIKISNSTLFNNSINLKYIDFNNLEKCASVTQSFKNCPIDTIRVKQRIKCGTNNLCINAMLGGLDKSKITLLVPTDSIDVFQTAPFWSEFGKIIEDNFDNTNVDNIEIKNYLTVFPNPIKNSFTIKDLTNPAQITVVNQLGTKILNLEINPNQSIFIGYLPKGIYIFLVKTNHKNYTIKVIKK